MIRRPLRFEDSGLTKAEWQALKSLKTPEKIQDFLNSLPFNFEKRGETYMSVLRTLRKGKAHCFEGALIAAAALWVAGEKPLLLDLKSSKKDVDHVVALFQRGGYWGAISKTNHAVLRYREPVYKTIRELALSYFHEYFLPNGEKTMVSFSRPFDLSRVGKRWLSTRDDLDDLVDALDRSPHEPVREGRRKFRKADAIEIRAGDIVEWPKGKRRK